MIDLGQVASFHFKRNPPSKKQGGLVEINLNVAGTPMTLYDDEAREVYNKLTSDKQVI